MKEYIVDYWIIPTCHKNIKTKFSIMACLILRHPQFRKKSKTANSKHKNKQ